MTLFDNITRKSTNILLFILNIYAIFIILFSYNFPLETDIVPLDYSTRRTYTRRISVTLVNGESAISYIPKNEEIPKSFIVEYRRSFMNKLVITKLEGE
jgi:uncharacterized membrane protein